MVRKTDNLRQAIKNKNDEFYTLYGTIEKEMPYYIKHFEDKIIYCNCDNPYKSNFVKYFINNFNKFKLQALVSTYYSNNDTVYKTIISNVPEGISDLDELLKLEGNIKVSLKGNGDFRSEECINILKQCDIIITNPPFSLYRDFINVVMKYNKNFIVLAPITTTVYKNVFPYIRDNKIRLGVTIRGKATNFTGEYGEHKQIRNIEWFTTLNHNFMSEPIKLVKSYNKEEYPFIDNYDDVININKVKDIPKDYNGLIAVPISYIYKHNSEQFKIVDYEVNPFVNGVNIFKRIIIQKI